VEKAKVIAGVAACAVGAMTSLLLLVIMLTERWNDGITDMINLLQSNPNPNPSNVHYVHTWWR